MANGLLDTNVFIHAQSTDAHSEECQSFLSAVERGSTRVRLAPLVLHELSYVLPRMFKQMDRTAVATYLTMVINWQGVDCDKAVFLDAVRRWAQTPGLGFVDAYLCAVASLSECPVYTKNVDDFVAQGVVVPNPLSNPELAS